MAAEACHRRISAPAPAQHPHHEKTGVMRIFSEGFSPHDTLNRRGRCGRTTRGRAV